MPTEEITVHFNELRQDIVLLYELKLGLANCDYELETLKHQYETLNPGKVREIGLLYDIDRKSHNAFLHNLIKRKYFGVASLGRVTHRYHSSVCIGRESICVCVRVCLCD